MKHMAMLLLLLLLTGTAAAEAFETYVDEIGVLLRVEDGWFTMIDDEDGAYLSVPVKEGFAAQLRADAQNVNRLPTPGNGMPKAYRALIGDVLTDGYVVADIDVHRTEILLLLDREDGTRFLRFAQWFEMQQLFGFQDTENVPSNAAFDTQHASDGVALIGFGMDGMLSFRQEQDGRYWYLHQVNNTAYRVYPNALVDLDRISLSRNDGFYYGYHPWSGVDGMDAAQVPPTLEEALLQLNDENCAVVNNPNPADRLHLREKANKSSRSLGKFYNRTPVRIHSIKGDWAYVSVGAGMTGYMMKKYLAFGDEMDDVACAFPGMEFVEGASRNVYSEPKKLVSLVNFVGDGNEFIVGVYGDDWVIVLDPVTERIGYVPAEEFWAGNG